MADRPAGVCVCVRVCVCVCVCVMHLFRITEMCDGRQNIRCVNSGGLLNSAPVTGDDVERVSTGTKFALRQWLTATASTA